MKKFLVAIMFGFMAIAAQAEATFDQVQTLIEQHQYQAAASGLETIIQNHPKSSKAFYAMAQAQAGLGNLEKAQKALNIATGLNPTLDFAPSSSVASLKQAITPQVSKIEAVEESHAFRNFMLFVMFAGFGLAGYILYSMYMRNQEQEAQEKIDAEKREVARAEREARWDKERAELATKMEAERAAIEAAEAALKAHKNYGHERFDPANPDKLKSVKQFKDESAEKQRLFLEAEARRERLRADAAEDEARRARNYSQPTQVVHTNSGSNDMLTGVLIGNMLSSSHHDTTRVVEREVIREVPAPSRDNSWDDTPSKPSRSNSWDDDSSSSSSKSSSSWTSSSSSDSSSSWSDSSSSSSSDSSSSGSWD